MTSLTRVALSAGAVAAFLTGCSGSRTSSGSAGVIPQTSIGVSRADRGGSWMLPEAKSEDLLYVTNSFGSGENTNAYFFSFPSGTLVGILTGFQNPQGICSDKNGNVFITDAKADDIFEYPHGGTSASNTLSDSGHPVACAVDSVTGNLAAANRDDTVSIYKDTSGSPVSISLPWQPYFATYDTSGNLYVSGTNNTRLIVDKLPKGSSGFVYITLPRLRDRYPSGIQWYGGHLLVGTSGDDPYECCGKVYRYEISGNTGKSAGRYSFGGYLGNFFIYNSVLSATAFSREVYLVHYPKLRRVIQKFNDPGGYAFGVTVSVAPSR